MWKRLLSVFLLPLVPGLFAADRISASSDQPLHLVRQSLPLISSGAPDYNRPKDTDLSAVRKSLQTKLDELHNAGSFPGATLGFVLPDGRSGAVSVGLADLETRIPLKPTDRMLAGSIGKTYVSAAMLQIVQEGKVDLDAKIERWLGSEVWFPRLPNAREITLRMLMNHSSGIPEHVLDKNFIEAMKKDPDRIWKPEELIAYIF